MGNAWREKEREFKSASLLFEIISFPLLLLPVFYLPSFERKNKWCAVWKTTPMTVSNLWPIERPRQIKSRFSSNTRLVDPKRRLSRAEATTPLQLELEKWRTGLRYVCRCSTSTINSHESADRRLNRRCSFSKRTLSIVFYYVSVCSRAVIRPLCSSLFAVPSTDRVMPEDE